jgi:hypothetical protein
MPYRNDKPLPFALAPWHLRVPPALLGSRFPGDWWWRGNDARDWGSLLPDPDRKPL